MREGLFRGRRIDDGKWVYGYYVVDYRRNQHMIFFNKVSGAINAGSEPGQDDYDLEICEVDPGTVGQLVRKGSETRFDLYEGDILADDWGYKYVIEWDEQATVYRARDIITGELETLHDKWAIGTEHDNPELLEDDAEQSDVVLFGLPDAIVCPHCGENATINFHAERGELFDYFYECSCGGLFEGMENGC